jgi:hypothetical protein
LPDLFPVYFTGVKTSRDEFLVDIDKKLLEDRTGAYFDPGLSHEEIGGRWPRLMERTARYEPHEIRQYLVKRGRAMGSITRFAYRPFDVRWLYWEPETKLLDEKRSEYFLHVFPGNLWIAAAQHHRRGFDPPAVSPHWGCIHLDERSTNVFPIYLKEDAASGNLFEKEKKAARPNLSEASHEYIAKLHATPEDLFFHCLAAFFSPVYVDQNSFSLRQDWPRIPLPKVKKALQASAALGRRIAALLDTENPVEGVTTGKIDPRLKEIAVISKVGEGGLNPDEGYLDLTAG